MIFVVVGVSIKTKNTLITLSLRCLFVLPTQILTQFYNSWLTPSAHAQTFELFSSFHEFS